MTVGEFKTWLERNAVSDGAVLIVAPGATKHEEALPFMDVRFADEQPIVLFEW
jgi:hypothetical protein